jgi:hypothetical protein
MPKAALAMAITKPFAMPMQPPFKPSAQYVEVGSDSWFTGNLPQPRGILHYVDPTNQ